MKISSYLLWAAMFIMFAACSSDSEPNTLSNWEADEGFELIFDGTSTEGWRGYLKDYFPPRWIIEDGALCCQSSGRGEAGALDGGDILFNKKYSDFHLKLEWKIAEGGNSGIFYLGKEDTAFSAIYMTAPEMQVLDNDKHPDAKLGKAGNRQAGSLYDLIPANPQNTLIVGEWNQVEIIHKKGHVIHKQNGEVVLEYQIGTTEWKELVSGSKFPGLNSNWDEVPCEGYIALQDHGDDVWYRSIKIKEL